MSSDELADFWIHTATVRSYVKTTGSGVKVYDEPVTVPCLLARKRRFVRDRNNEQVPSQTTMSAPINFADVLTAEALVTVDGVDTTVIAVEVSTGGPLIEGIDRVKAYLQ